MELNANEQSILESLRQYAAGRDFILNPDTETLNRVIHGLAMREAKTGSRYCPCRIVGKDPAENAKIVCPCVYHEEEIARDGQCHCQLFVRK